MNAKEKLKQLLEKGELTPEDLKELGIAFEEDMPTENNDNPQVENDPEPTTDDESHDIPENTEETDSGNSQTNADTEPEELPTDEPNDGIPEQDTPQPEESALPANSTPAVDYSALIEELKNTNVALAARIDALEQAIQTFQIPIPSNEPTNSDFGLNGNAPSNKDENNFMDDIVKRMGGFTR